MLQCHGLTSVFSDALLVLTLKLQKRYIYQNLSSLIHIKGNVSAEFDNHQNVKIVIALLCFRLIQS